MSSSDDPAPRLPAPYQRPVPLAAERHAETRLDTGVGHGFAAEMTSVPLNAVEFAAAARHYPIVFTPGDDPVPVAVVGIEAGRNLFVQDGRWAPGCYVPAYIRRYPFIFIERQGEDRLTLCIDEAAPSVTTEKRGQALIIDGEPSELTRRALDFCTAYQQEVAKTRAFVEALRAQEVLVQRQAKVRQGEAERSLGGFQAVDEARFNALEDEMLLDWRRRGFLPILYAHLLSVGAWESLSLRNQPKSA